MKGFLWLWLLLFPALVFAQEDTEVQRFSGDLGIGQDFDFGETAVSFLGVVSDSRCPTKVTCIWPGEARVLLGITTNGKYSEMEVIMNGGGVEIPLANDLLLQFSQLRPYPETSVKIPAEAYSLSFSALLPAEN